MNNLYLVSKAGRCRSGSDASGSIWHYSELDPTIGNGVDHPALCGAFPHIMWSDGRQCGDRRVTCKKCKKLAAERSNASNAQ